MLHLFSKPVFQRAVYFYFHWGQFVCWNDPTAFIFKLSCSLFTLVPPSGSRGYLHGTGDDLWNHLSTCQSSLKSCFKAICAHLSKLVQCGVLLTASWGCGCSHCCQSFSHNSLVHLSCWKPGQQTQLNVILSDTPWLFVSSPFTWPCHCISESLLLWQLSGWGEGSVLHVWRSEMCASAHGCRQAARQLSLRTPLIAARGGWTGMNKLTTDCVCS